MRVYPIPAPDISPVPDLAVAGTAWIQPDLPQLTKASPGRAPRLHVRQAKRAVVDNPAVQFSLDWPDPRTLGAQRSSGAMHCGNLRGCRTHQQAQRALGGGSSGATMLGKDYVMQGSLSLFCPVKLNLYFVGHHVSSDVQLSESILVQDGQGKRRKGRRRKRPKKTKQPTPPRPQSTSREET